MVLIGWLKYNINVGHLMWLKVMGQSERTISNRFKKKLHPSQYSVEDKELWMLKAIYQYPSICFGHAMRCTDHWNSITSRILNGYSCMAQRHNQLEKHQVLQSDIIKPSEPYVGSSHQRKP
eukprot:855614_1